ncbi:MAG TPA: AarF/UbiB family protein [Opitutaceae bacterium]
MKPFDLFSHAVRAKEIFSVLARHGFSDLLDQLDLPVGIRERLGPTPQAERNVWVRIRLVLEDLGPTFVKFGQLMSMRPDALPAPLILELRKLQDHVRPVPFEDIRPILAEAIPGELSAIFTEFNETPIASASLAQVYFGRLRSDARCVAVKVQRPHIARTVQVDLEFAAWIAGQLHQRFAGLRPYDLPVVIEEIREGLKRELDFSGEARNQQYFNTQNPFPDRVFAPAVVNELTSERVLVMDHVEGKPAGRAPITPELGRLLAGFGARSIVHQILIAGFFHADPHAGNVIVTPDGRLCFIDWGLAGHLTRRLRYALADFWLAAVEQDAERIVQIALRLGSTGRRFDQRVMEKEVTLALREELNFAIGRQELGRAMLKLLFIFGQHGVMLSRDYSLMAKAILSIEEIGRLLDPQFDLRVHTEEVLREVYSERANPKTLAREFKDFVRNSAHTLREMPDEMHRILRRLENDDLTVNFNHQGLEDLDDGLRTAANRLTVGIIIASLVIGSAHLMTTHIPPFIGDYPLWGVIGFVTSFLLGIYVVWDIIRHGRHK